MNFLSMCGDKKSNIPSILKLYLSKSVYFLNTPINLIMKTNKTTPTKTFIKLFNIILTGKKDDSRKAARGDFFIPPPQKSPQLLPFRFLREL